MLAVSATPPADLITIKGPEFSLRLTNSAGITTNVPADHYTVEVSYAYWRQMQETAVNAGLAGRCAFAPRLGAAQLTCNQSGASFQLFDASNQLMDAGDFPMRMVEMPEDDYRLIAWHHKNKNEQTLAVKAGITNDVEIQFLYGSASLATEPSGATVLSIDGQELGVTPRLITELTAGRWQFQLRLAGYSPATVVLNVAAGQTNEFSTNLVSLDYVRSMRAARQYLATADYDRASAAAAEALQVKPNDPEGIAVQQEAIGKGHLRQAEAFGKNGDYIGADRELEATLQSLPDNGEAKQLLADFKARESQQREQQREERLVRGKKLFGSVVASVTDADLFESHELKTSMPVERVKALILDALKIRPEFRLTKCETIAPETFEVEAVQELNTVLATSAGRRECIIVGAQTQDDKTDILFKVLEYKSEAVEKFSIGALIGAPVAVTYVPIHASRIPKMTDKLKAQLEEGQKMVTGRIRQAIGGGTEKK
jgi:tetratricopeptide (TPR) repeat protein